MQISYNLYCNDTGYSIAAQEYILALLSVKPELDIKTNFLNTAYTGVSKQRLKLFTTLQKKSERPGRVEIWHSIPHRYCKKTGASKSIGVCLFETMNPPDNWIQMMNQMDAIITASHFNKHVFENNGVTVPVYVVPHPFDQKMFHKNVNPAGRYNLFTFFALGTWKHKMRKNWESLVKAFYSAFENKDRVCLLVKTENPKEFQAMVERVKRTCEWRSKDTAPIFAESKSRCSFEDIPAIMKKGDVYVCPSLGEGFGLAGLHAMALAVPVITTKFGGTLEYAKTEHTKYIEPKFYKTYPVMDNVPQFRNCIWPVFRVSDIANQLRDAFVNRQVLRLNAMKAYKYVHENFNYDQVGRKLYEVISA